MKINPNSPILVTGANGYVASWIVKKLLDQGHTVNAAVRNPNDKAKHAHLLSLSEDSKGELKLFHSDLLEEGSFDEAIQGCELVYHTASPFTTDVKNPEKELIQPAVKGTQNVLNSALKASSVKRVVVTSSCAAMYTDAIDTLNTPTGMLTESVWNETASIDYQPYNLSKTLAEKKAWEIAKSQNKFDLITINMSLVLGPPLNPKHATSESMNILKLLGNGDMKFGVPKMGVGLVDVRDVAEAHYLAGFNPKAEGRYITSAHNTNFLEMSEALLPRYGDNYPLPKRALPKWLLLLFGPMVNSLFTRRFIKNNVNVEWKADNSKVKSHLGLSFLSLKTTMDDSFQALIDAGVLSSK